MAGRRVQPLSYPELCGLSSALCPHAVAQQRLAALRHLCREHFVEVRVPCLEPTLGR